jgi:hypothetical protein
LCPQQKTTLTFVALPSCFIQEFSVGLKSGHGSQHASSGNIIARPVPHSALAVFDASHGQPNWAQTGFTSREMHTNFAGLMELLCRFGLLPGANVQPLALSSGGCCISFNRSLRRISFSSLPIAVAGTLNRGRFVLCGGPHVFETGSYGLLASHDNARLLQNIVRWLLDDGDPRLNSEMVPNHSLGTFFFNNRLEIEHEIEAQKDQQTIAYVEKMPRRTGILQALNRPKWVP